MPIHSFADMPERATDAEVLVVGAGAVGIAMAVRLARAGRRVTLLEGGPAEPDAGWRNRNGGPIGDRGTIGDGGTAGRTFDGLIEGRMQALGGTTRLWGGQLVPFDAGDLAARDEGGRRLWPIDYAEFAAGVAEAYTFLGIDAAGRDTAALWRRITGARPQLERSADGDPQARITFHMNIWLPQPDFRHLFAADLERRVNLTVVTDAPVRALRFAADGAVTGVLAGTTADDARVFRAPQVVLAAGTIEIARLLLGAAADAPHCPFADNRHLGRWFMDHLHGLCGTIEHPDTRRLGRLFDNVYFGGRKYSVKLRRERGEGLANAAATLNARVGTGDLVRDARGLARRLLGGHNGGGGGLIAARRALTLARIVVPLAWRYLVRRRSTSLLASGVALGIELEQMPNPGSYIFLDPAAPPGIARAGVRWALRGDEIDALADLAVRLRTWFAAERLGRVMLDPRVERRDPALLDGLHDASHHMGGARMAESAEHGVVDRECRVFGAPGLTIGGAAVFPSGSFANPTLSAIALGLRAADRIAGEVAAGLPEGDLGLLVSRLVFGCARLPAGVSAGQGLRLIEAALAAGVTAIDTAPNYGMGLAEVVAGRALARARAAGREVRVIAKVGSLRPSHPLLRSGLRAAKRALRPPPPRALDDFAPLSPVASFGRGDFTPQALRRSVALSRARLGLIDDLLIHDCAPGDFGEAQRAALDVLAREAGARPGYALSSIFDPPTDAHYPADYVAECAIVPAMLTGRWCAPLPKTAILHSIVPTGEWLTRTDPAFAAALARAAALVPGANPAAARIAVLYALAAAHVPSAQLVFASAVEGRLSALLSAFAAIDREGLIGPVAACFAEAIGGR